MRKELFGHYAVFDAEGNRLGVFEGNDPLWSTDSQRLYFGNPDELLYVDMIGGSQTPGFKAAEAFGVVVTHRENYDYDFVKQDGAYLNPVRQLLKDHGIDNTKAVNKVIPDSIYRQRKHPDIRIARRASTIASLARVISERKVSKGLRQTLLTQARRLERLAAERLKDFPKDVVENNEE